jgi:hypothetical protein
MILFIAQAITSDRPVIFSICAISAALIACFAALIAKRSVEKDREILKMADDKFVLPAAWLDGYCKNETNLNAWLNLNKIDPRSGVGGIVRIAWSAWMCGRATTTSEIHSYIARLERNKIAPRFSGGIAALLLIVGIAGTLMSVHPRNY